MRPMAMLVVQLPRGRRAVVRVDVATGAATTTHAGVLAAFFHKGVRDWEGRLLRPNDGRRFLMALYDRLFLSGYTVHWLPVAADPEGQWLHSPPGCPDE